MCTVIINRIYAPIISVLFALLVTTFNSPEREPLYTPRLRWWLYNSALDLFVVDSAGRCFPDLRVRCHAFNYSAAGSPLLRASIGDAELDELEQAAEVAEL